MKASHGSTIFALSSGPPPAGIAIIRVSGPQAGAALEALAGRLPAARRATYCEIRVPVSGDLLDRGLVLWFPGPRSATGEDLAELHLHGGRAVVAGVLEALGSLSGLRAAEAGEFTRRAFENGRIDLAEAEGLSDLLSAETQSQRRAAMTLAGGELGRLVADWQSRVLRLAAEIEAQLDFSDEGDVADDLPVEWRAAMGALVQDMNARLARPPAERLKDGIRVVVAGPPNAGKSSLINALADREAAIISPLAGTTRDVIEVPIALSGVPFVLTDTAGLRESDDEIERIGVERAQARLAGADIVLWLGHPEEAPDNAVLVAAKSDLRSGGDDGSALAVSSATGEGMNELRRLLLSQAKSLLPGEGEVALNARHRSILGACAGHLAHAELATDLLAAAEELRLARMELDRISGRAGVEDMLDTLFGTFCIGK